MTRSAPSSAATELPIENQPEVLRGGVPIGRADISLVVSTIGRPSMFRRLVESIEIETTSGRLDVELVVVDQGSSSETREVLQGSDFPFAWTYTRSALGASLGRNVGLGLAGGRYVMFPDDDAWFSGTTLLRALSHLEAHPEHDGFCTQLRDADNELSMLRWAPTSRVVTMGNHHRTSIGSTMLFRTTVAVRAGGFDEKMGPGSGGSIGSCEDSDFLLRIIAAGATVWYDPDVVMHHRDARLDGGRDAAVKSLAYGCGQGHLWRTHLFPRWLVLSLLVRRLAGSLVQALAGRPDVGRSHRAWVRGALNGYFGKSPMGLEGGPAAGRSKSSAPSRAEFGRSFVWRLLISPIGTAATFSLTAVATRTLVDREVTFLYALLAALMIGPILSRFGLNQKAVQQIAAARTQFERPIAVAMARRHVRLSLLPAAFAAPLVAILFALTASGAGGYLIAIGLTAVVLFTESVRLTISDVMTALGETTTGAILAHQLRAVAVIVAVVGWVLLSPDAIDFQKLLIIMAAVGLVLLAVGYQRLYRLPRAELKDDLSSRDLRPLLRAGLPFLVVDLVAVVVARGDVWLAASAFTDQQAAFYSTGSVLAVQVATPIGLASIALAPIVAGYVAQNRLEELSRLVRSVTTLAACVMLPVVVVTIMAGDRLLALAYGERFAEAHPYLVTLMIGNLALTTLGTSAVVLVMGSRQRVAMTVSAAWFGIAAPLAAAAAFFGGPTLLAVTSACTTIGLYFLMALAVWVRTGINVMPYWQIWRVGLPWNALPLGSKTNVGKVEGVDGR